MANDRISQLPIEVLIEPTDQKARISQLPVEALIEPTNASARVSQIAIEVLIDMADPPVTFKGTPRRGNRLAV